MLSLLQTCLVGELNLVRCIAQAGTKLHGLQVFFSNRPTSGLNNIHALVKAFVMYCVHFYVRAFSVVYI